MKEPRMLLLLQLCEQVNLIQVVNCEKRATSECRVHKRKRGRAQGKLEVMENQSIFKEPKKRNY